MAENEFNLLNQCRVQIAHTGKLMNIFSIFAALGMLFMVAGGIVLLAYGSRIDPDMPNYMTLLISFAGIGMILIAAVLIIPLMRMREAVRMAKAVANNIDVSPMIAYHRVVRGLWRYMMWFIGVIFVLALIGALVASVIVLSVHNLV